MRVKSQYGDIMQKYDKEQIIDKGCNIDYKIND